MAAAQAMLAVASALSGKLGASSSPALSPAPQPVALDGHTVRDVVNEFLVAKARVGRSDRYLRQVRVSLSSFAKNRGHVPISAVTLADVEKWLSSRDWSARTQRGYLADVRTLFNFAARRGYVANANATRLELPDDNSKLEAPEIHAVRQVARVLHTARVTELDVLRHLAVRYFAGVRSAEAHRLREENLLLDRGYIEVPASKSKTRRRRLVKIQPVLSKWLQLGGALRPMRPDTVRSVIRASGVEWPKNVTRHSFVSYHLAAFQNAAKTALEAGHSEAMLFAHYRELVTPEAAAEFWALTPERAEAVSQSSP
jgi:integrase